MQGLPTHLSEEAEVSDSLRHGKFPVWNYYLSTQYFNKQSHILFRSAMRNSPCLFLKRDCKAGITIVTGQERNSRKSSISSLIWSRFILYLLCRLSVIKLIGYRTVGSCWNKNLQRNFLQG